MGVSLHNIPCIRKLFRKSVLACSVFDLNEPISPVVGHVISARICSDISSCSIGIIHDINFVSSASVYGYFSIKAPGKLHIYSDKQFGHIFSFSDTRSNARKNLLASLFTLNVVGQIQTNLDLLKMILVSKDFVHNSVSINWLESIYNNPDTASACLFLLCAALKVALVHFETSFSDFVGDLKNLKLPSSQKYYSKFFTLPVVLLYLNLTYNFVVTKLESDCYYVTINNWGAIVKCKILVAPNCLYINALNESFVCSTVKTYSGINVHIHGKTLEILFNKDLSSLKSKISGKIVRYLISDGMSVVCGIPFVEIEVMKMLVTLHTEASGIFVANSTAGTSINVGDIIGTLKLEETSNSYF